MSRVAPTYVAAKQACPSALYGCRILKEILKHLSPPFWLENDGGEESRIMPRLQEGQGEKTEPTALLSA